MKKILLFLSCFLTTWCGVQSALAASSNEPGQITSATYNDKDSKIYVNYTTHNVSKAKLGLMSMQKGNSVYDPLSPTYPNVANVPNYSSTEPVKVDPTWEEGLFYVYLYVNGSSIPCSSSSSVNVTAKGSINSFSPAQSNKKLTVNYSMQHGSTYYSSIKIYKGTKFVTKIDLSNPNSSTNKNITFDYSSILEEGIEYTYTLYSKEKPLNSCTYKIPIVPVPVVKGEIKDAVYTPSNNTIDVDYTLKNAKSANINIYNASGKLIKNGGTIANSSSVKRITIENVSFENGYYAEISAISSDGKKVTIRKFISTVAVDVVSPAYADNEIRNMWYDRSTNRIYVDFNLKTSGVTVGLSLLSTKSGAGWKSGPSWYDMQSYGTTYIDVPSESGCVLYIVVLTVNGEGVASKQIVISR